LLLVTWPYSSRSQQLTEEEMLSKEAFFGRCMHNPSIRDRLPILTRSLSMNRKVEPSTVNHVYDCSAHTTRACGKWVIFWRSSSC